MHTGLGSCVFFSLMLMLFVAPAASIRPLLRGNSKGRQLLANHQMALYVMHHGAGWQYPSPPPPDAMSPPPPLSPPAPPGPPPPHYPPGLCAGTPKLDCVDKHGHLIDAVKRINTERAHRLAANRMYDAVAEAHESKFNLKDYARLRSGWGI
mmetsp:Transcript_35554/g.68157  ORF Transcript_35554/g.68157 Transcript_35554/m.68157 type:complete len:152 (-) Transcript_35554:426-881(-)